MNQPLVLTTVKPVCGRDCPERSIDCHGKCEKYKAYRTRCDSAAKERFLKKQGERDVNQAVSKAVKRLPGKRRY